MSPAAARGYGAYWAKTMDKTAMNDAQLRSALEGGDTAADPAFRLRVMQRICDRARRRAAAERMVTWIVAGAAIGLVAQTLTPASSGTPGLEAAAMISSLLAAALLLAESATTGPARLAHRLQQFVRAE